MSEKDESNGVEEESKIEAFLPRLRDELKLLAQRESYKDIPQSFAHWSIRQISPQLHEKSIQPAILSGPNKSLCRALWIDTEVYHQKNGTKGVLNVALFRWRENSDSSPEELMDLLEGLLVFIHQVQNDSSNLTRGADLAAITQTTQRQGLPIRGLVVFDTEVPGKHRERALKRGNTTESSLEVIDLRQLYDLYLLRLDTVELTIPSVVSFKALGQPTSVASLPGRAVTLQVSLAEIYKLVRDHQLSLFSKNLRVPMIGSRYNKKIQEVISDQTERVNFWYFNNGITAICDYFDVEYSELAFSSTVKAKRLQIVNGCQTSMTVYNEGSRLMESTGSVKMLEEATVLVRLIQLPEKEPERSSLAQRIARFTNSQTPITGRDLHATDQIQGKFREEMTRDWRIFFETKKHEWRRRLDQNRSFKQSFLWPFMIQNDLAGQLYLAFWMQRPAFAKNHKKDIFEDEEVYHSIFGIRTTSEALLIPYFLFTLLEEWRNKRGYKKRHRGPGSAHRVSRDKVVAQGDFYLLSMLGVSLKQLLEINTVEGADVIELRNMAHNLRLANTGYGGGLQGTSSRLARSIDSAYDEALSIIYKFVVRHCDADPYLDVRNLLVRDSAWEDLHLEFAGGIALLLGQSRTYLLNQIG